MKKLILAPILFVSVLMILSFERTGTVVIEKKCDRKNANGAPSGRTGAPGEPSCATSLCHDGMTQDGAPENVLTLLDGVTPVTDYVPGQTYNVVLAMTSNPTKRGFQATALTSANAMAGNFTGQVTGGTAITSSAGRKYANHTSASNLTSQLSQWVWTWTAPATNVGTITFYVASNKTNNNNNSSGDVIYLSQHQFGSTVGVEEIETPAFEIGYNVDLHQLELSLESSLVDLMILNLVDLNGKSIFHAELGKSVDGSTNTSVKLPSNVNNGIYIATLFVGNKPFSKKVMVQR